MATPTTPGHRDYSKVKPEPVEKRQDEVDKRKQGEKDAYRKASKKALGK